MPSRKRRNQPSPAAPASGLADAVRRAVGDVTEPELRRSLDELGLVREVRVDGDRAVVSVALPAEPYFESDEVTARVAGAAGAVEGVADVDVELSVLDETEQEALRRQLAGDPASTAGAQQAHGHAEGRAIPFNQPGSRTRVLLVASGKGGVGKSSVSTNLAVCLGERGHDVALVDADVWGFSIPRMIGVDRPPLVVDRLLVPPRVHGVRLISMGFFTRESEPVIWRGPMLHKALEQFLTDVFWDDPDFLVVDLPPGTGDISLSLAQFLPRGEVYVVTTPQAAAQSVAQRAAFMARKVNLQVRGVIENMSWFTGDDGKRYELFGSGGGQELAELLEVPLVGQVPLVPALRAGGDEGRPIVAMEPDGEAAGAFRSLAQAIDEHPPPRRYHPELTLT